MMRGNRAESLREEDLSLRWSSRGPPKTSERYIGKIKSKSQKGTCQRFAQVLSETLSEDDFPHAMESF